MSQDDLARRIGKSQSIIARYEAGELSPVDPDIVFALERALRVPPGTLSRHLGYLPSDVRETPFTVVDAIQHDAVLLPSNKRALIRMYREYVRDRVEA